VQLGEISAEHLDVIQRVGPARMTRDHVICQGVSEAKMVVVSCVLLLQPRHLFGDADLHQVTWPTPRSSASSSAMGCLKSRN
jgi:hypothetical protein